MICFGAYHNMTMVGRDKLFSYDSNCALFISSRVGGSVVEKIWEGGRLLYDFQNLFQN